MLCHRRQLRPDGRLDKFREHVNNGWPAGERQLLKSRVCLCWQAVLRKGLTMRAQAGPAQSPSQRSLGGHSLGPASPMSDSLGLPANEPGANFPAASPFSPPQDRMDDECALRYACSLAVKHGVYQVREFLTMHFTMLLHGFDSDLRARGQGACRE